jgi:hypothetical protein
MVETHGLFDPLYLSHIEHDDRTADRVEHSIRMKTAPTPFVQNKAEYNQI